MDVMVGLAVVVGAGAVGGIVARVLRLPVMLGYMAAGMVLTSFGWTSGSEWSQLGRVGVTFLLFLVGLELPIGELKRYGKTVLITGLAQVGITTVAGFLLAKVLGFGSVEALFLGVALTFSSTVVVVKILSEKRELDSLHGKLAVGSLLIQDFVAVGILILLAGVGSNLGLVAIKGIVLVGIMLFLAETVAPRVAEWLAETTEGVYVFFLAWCLGVAAVVGSGWVGFTPELGGLLAGLAMAGAAQKLEVMAKMRPLRDFFMVVFFVALGAELGLVGVGKWWLPAGVLATYVTIGNPLIMMLILTTLGYGRRTAFLAGLTMGQVSEFSIIVVAAGMKAGKVGGEVLGVVTLVGMISMAVCSFVLMRADKVYRLVGKWVPIGKRKKETGVYETLAGHVVLFGHSRTGSAVRPVLEKMGNKVLVVDFDPMVIDRLKGEGVDAVYGDLSDVEIYDELGIGNANLIISTVPDVQDNLLLLEKVKHNGHRKIVVTADDDREAEELYAAGADFVLVPHRVGGEYLAHLLEKGVI